MSSGFHAVQCSIVPDVFIRDECGMFVIEMLPNLHEGVQVHGPGSDPGIGVFQNLLILFAEDIFQPVMAQFLKKLVF
jgi:hypothetical protein